MARTKQTRSLSMRTTGQFGGKQPRTIPAPPPPPQKLHECLAIIEQKTEPHYKAVACIDNKNINRVPEKELCKSVEATIDRVIQSCWTDYFISDSDVYFTVVILCYWAVRDDDRQKRFKKSSNHDTPVHKPPQLHWNASTILIPGAQVPPDTRSAAPRLICPCTLILSTSGTYSRGQTPDQPQPTVVQDRARAALAFD
jgi:hypothetical protein